MNKYVIKGVMTGLIIWFGWVILKFVVDGNNYFGERAPFPLSQLFKESLIMLIFIIIVSVLIFICSKPVIQSRWYPWLKGLSIGIISYIILTISIYAGEMFSCGGEGMCGLITAWAAVIDLVLIPFGLIVGFVTGLVKNRNRTAF